MGLRGAPRGTASSLPLQFRGAGQNKSTDPPVQLLNPRPTPPPTQIFWVFFLVCFWAFLGKGSSKTPYKYFCKKSMSKQFPKKSTKISMSVFPRLPLFYRVFGFFSAMGVQKGTTKNVLQTKPCRKVCKTNSTKNPKTKNHFSRGNREKKCRPLGSWQFTAAKGGEASKQASKHARFPSFN
jgi:hypothetical protein